MEKIKKAVVINDLSGVGRCSLTVALPILSAMGIQCIPFPTAILSNQTNYKEYYFKDLTSSMEKYKRGLNNLNLEFNAIYSGFLGSLEQINIVSDFIYENKNSIVIVDPVMGEDGERYSTYTEEMCSSMKELVKHSNIVTPNLTEACILTNTPYKDFSLNRQNIIELCKKISKLGPEKVIITGVAKKDKIYNYGYDKILEKVYITESLYNGLYYSGTGDIFSSIILGSILQKKNMESAMKNATNFLEEVINYTSNFNLDPNEGILFEPFLRRLCIDEGKSQN